MRYRGGDCKPVLCKTHPSYPIEEGDLLFRHPADNTARPASAMANQGTVALNQDAFAEYFLGVALQKNGLQPGETSFRVTTDLGYVMVATAGRFEFDCDSQEWQAGDSVAVAATVNGCSAQEVAPPDSGSSLQLERAIGAAVPGVAGISGASTTRIVVEICSRIMNPDVPTPGKYSGASGQ
jgi:hypothetical protein